MEENNQGGNKEESIVVREEDYFSDEEKGTDKKMKNLISLVILLFGLFVGSLFVDIGQLVKGEGYSQKNLSRSDIFEANGKTWVAYDAPAVGVSVITDDTCEKCDPSEAIVWLRRVMPTVSAEKINYDSVRGTEILNQYGIKTLPAFIFDNNIEGTELYAQAREIFESKDGSYVLNTQALGLPAGKYLSTPTINEGDAVSGNLDAKVKVVVFSDFQCPYCKVFHTALRDVMREYNEKVTFAFKEFPLDIHPQAVPAALAAECALEQNKFWEYGDLLFEKQADWGNAKDDTPFKTYARNLGLNATQFNECLDAKKYQDKIEKDMEEAAGFGISGTPTVFVGDKVESGALTADDLKKNIEEQLAK